MEIKCVVRKIASHYELSFLFSSFSQVRVDSGIQPGSDISIYYDPMISKVSSTLNGSFQFSSEWQWTYIIKKSGMGLLPESCAVIKHIVGAT